MNSTNPLKPQGSQFEQAASAARGRFQLAVYVSLALCAVGLTVLLAVGCKKEDPYPPAPPQPATDSGSTVTPTPVDTNPLPGTAGTPLPGPEVAPSNTTPAQPTTPGAEATVPVTPGIGGGPVLPPPVHDTPPVTPTPTAPTGMKEYVVQQGESFYTIGKKLGVNWKAIEKANPTLNPAKLKKGDKIMVPEPAAHPTPTAGATEPAPTAGTVTHKVAAGENLGKIANKYRISVKAIQKANNLTTTRIKVGDKLTIPAKAAPAEPTAPTTTPAAPGGTSPGLPPIPSSPTPGVPPPASGTGPRPA